MSNTFGVSSSEVPRWPKRWQRVFLSSSTTRYFKTLCVTQKSGRTIAFGIIQGLEDAKRDAGMAIRTTINKGAPVEIARS